MSAGRPPRPREPGAARARPAGGAAPGLAAAVCRLILLRLFVELGRVVYEYFL